MATIDGYGLSIANSTSVGSLDYFGQSFACSGNFILETVTFRLQRQFAGSGSMYAMIYAHSGTYGTSSLPTGSPLASSSFVSESVISASANTNVSFQFVGSQKIELHANTKYVVVLSKAGSTANLQSAYSSSGPGGVPNTAHGGNAVIYRSSTGWQASPGFDYSFSVTGEPIPERYWIGGSGSWSDTAHWSTASGGTGGATVPTSTNTVFFDDSSGFDSGGTVTIAANHAVESLDSSGCTGNFTIQGDHRLSVSHAFSGHGGLTLDINELRFNQSVTGFDVPIDFAGTQLDCNVLLTNNSGSNKPDYFLNSPIAQVWPYSLATNNCTFNSQDNDLIINDFNIGNNSSATLGMSELIIDDALTIAATATFTGANASFIFTGTDTAGMYLDNRTFGSIRNSTTAGGHLEIYGNNVIGTLTLDAGTTTKFQNGCIQIVTNFNAVGSSGNEITIASTTPGSRFNLSSNEQRQVSDYLIVSDSGAMGAAEWWAGRHSVDSGNNTGWLFSAPTYSADIIGSASGGGLATLENEYASISIAGSASGGGSALYVTQYQALPQKDYEYRVFTPDGDYIGTWRNVESEFGYSQSINQNASELSVEIARSPDNVIISYDSVLDENSSTIRDDNNDIILVPTQSPNAVGPGTDVDLNYNVDIYAFYGGYEQLLDDDGDPILDENSEAILVQYGFPNGLRVYSGYIADYELTYGDRTGVKLLVVPHATEMSHYIFKSGSNTTVEYNSTDPALMARHAMDNYISQGGVVRYDESSIPLTTESTSYDFKLQTTRETMDIATSLLTLGHFHYVHPGENKQYLLSKGSTPDHVFYYEKHITTLNLKKSITQLVNKVYFVGGEITPGTDLFRYYEDAPSVVNYRPGLQRLADSRVKLNDTAAAFSQREIAEGKEPRYRTSVTISDAVYDIERIRLGDMIGFKNFGTFVDGLVLQVVTLQKNKHTVTLDLDQLVPSDAKRIETIKRSLLSEEIRNVPDAPS